MGKRFYLAAATATATAIAIMMLSTTAFAGKWLRTANGQIPNDSWQVGHNDQNTPFYLCRARYESGVHPGTISQNSKGCHISYRGKEEVIEHYQIYVDLNGAEPAGEWVKAWGGWVPKFSWRVGYDTSGQPLYLCLVNYKGLRAGALRNGIGGCDISYQGRQITLNRYQVFVKTLPTATE